LRGSLISLEDFNLGHHVDLIKKLNPHHGVTDVDFIKSTLIVLKLLSPKQIQTKKCKFNFDVFDVLCNMKKII
jgi:hypothetical protein